MSKTSLGKYKRLSKNPKLYKKSKNGINIRSYRKLRLTWRLTKAIVEMKCDTEQMMKLE